MDADAVVVTASLLVFSEVVGRGRFLESLVIMASSAKSVSVAVTMVSFCIFVSAMECFLWVLLGSRLCQLMRRALSVNAAVHISPSDITFNPSYSIMYVRVKASKTDPFRSGCVIRLAAIPNHAFVQSVLCVRI